MITFKSRLQEIIQSYSDDDNLRFANTLGISVISVPNWIYYLTPEQISDIVNLRCDSNLVA